MQFHRKQRLRSGFTPPRSWNCQGPWHGKEPLPIRDERTRTPAEKVAMIDSAVLDLMVIDGPARLWSPAEIDRAIGQDTTDSLSRLYAAGPIHRLEG